MLYAIFGNDIPDGQEKRAGARPAHVARLQALQDEGRLLLAGPSPAEGCHLTPVWPVIPAALIVAEFASLEAAQVWADADPYVATGVYAQVAVRPFKKVFPA